ncbi:hypothetical protein K439DRAFT_1616594 [Ramaria rubella]|nr:hypothetical protein K439DRAFT_1616594 [Ramaria rubella]
MPVCPFPACSQVFGKEKGLKIHVAKSNPCLNWLNRQLSARLDPDDLDNWPSIQEEPSGDLHGFEHEEDDDPEYDLTGMDVDDSYDEPPEKSPTPPPVPPVAHEADPHMHYYHYPFPNAAKTYGSATTPYENTKANKVDPLNPTYPFAGREEWELAKWLGSSGLPNTQIDSFLDLPWVKSHGPLAPSFKNSSGLAPLDPQLLLYHDPVECLEWLEANPEFKGEKDYMPYEEYLDAEMTEHCYSEMASGDAWHEHQTQFPDGVTINPAIFTTDATHLTNFSGDKKVKPFLVSSGHIHKGVWAKPTHRAFLACGFIPEGKFPNLEFENPTQAKLLPGILSRHLYHLCMKEILKPLVPFFQSSKGHG